MKHAITPIASYGDIVRVIGYGDHLFAVDAYTIEYHYEHDHEYCELLYDLTCVYGDSGYIVGEQDDISVVCKADQSHEFLKGMSTPPPVYKADWLTVIIDVDKPAVSSRKKPTKQQEIDGLLDELLTLKTVIDICGTDEDYAVRFTDVIAKLKEVAG